MRETREILVEEVSSGRDMVSIMALNSVKFTFFKGPDGVVRLVSKSKLGAQVRDPAACWVPKRIFTAVCRRAVAILKNQKSH